MHSQIPEPLRALVEQLARLPGLGPKSAMRVAMTLLKWPEAETRRLGKGIHDLRDNLHLCSRCGGLSATDPCDICKDENRSRDTLCLVNEWDSMLTLDEGGFYHGQYMILGGLLAPLANMDSDSLDLDRLISRLEEGEIHELILALGATIDAENTASFIRNLVRKRFPHILHHFVLLRTGKPELTSLLVFIAKYLDLCKQLRRILYLINEDRRFVGLKKQSGIGLSQCTCHHIVKRHVGAILPLA